MLMDAHRGAVKHLHFAVVGLADRGHDAVPNPGFAPSHKAVVAGCRRAVFLGQRPPRRACSQDPKFPSRTRRSSTRGTPRGLFGSNGAITPYSKSVSSYPCMIKPSQMESLNHTSIPAGIPFFMSL